MSRTLTPPRLSPALGARHARPAGAEGHSAACPLRAARCAPPPLSALRRRRRRRGPRSAPAALPSAPPALRRAARPLRAARGGGEGRGGGCGRRLPPPRRPAARPAAGRAAGAPQTLWFSGFLGFWLCWFFFWCFFGLGTLAGTSPPRDARVPEGLGKDGEGGKGVGRGLQGVRRGSLRGFRGEHGEPPWFAKFGGPPPLVTPSRALCWCCSCTSLNHIPRHGQEFCLTSPPPHPITLSNNPLAITHP